MSGIVGIFHTDGSPVDRGLLERMTQYQAFRGPDAQNTWWRQNAGFGHTLFRTSPESALEQQPFSLNGEVWIVADARVDSRHELIASLRSQDAEAPASATDAELILRAYHAWGEQCVEHLLGDFAFAIFDGPRQTLFCARDHMGVKPFYYAHLGSVVVFSNTLDCVRQHPAVSDRLNDQAIADFLILEENCDSSTTSFADIRRLPPAHRISWSDERACLGRYWTMPIEEPVFYRRSGDYQERFRELLHEVVADRVRGNRLGVLMSGGLDSPSLAAVSRNVFRERGGQFHLQAFTMTDSSNPDEQRYAGAVANSLDIPIQFYDTGEAALNPDWETESERTPEPGLCPWDARGYREFWKLIAAQTRVAFYGEGPDNALYFDWRPYVRYLLRQGRFVRLLRDLAATATSQRRPPFWDRLSRKLGDLRSPGSPQTTAPSLFPSMLNSDLESRLHLRARWETHWRDSASLYPRHPLRPQGYASLQIPLWQSLFEMQDMAVTRAMVEVRYPFVDVRMLRFLLALPPLPWCRSKYILRRAMRGVLPDSVLQRGKKGTSCKTHIERVRRNAARPMVPAPEIEEYVDLSRLPDTTSEDIWIVGHALLVHTLNNWLLSSHKLLQNDAGKGGIHGTVSGRSEGAGEA